MKKLKHLKSYVFILITTFLAVFFNLLARNSTKFAEWYAVKIYPLLVNTLGRFCSLFPFSVYELVIILAIGTVIFLLVSIIVSLVKRQKEKAYAGFLRIVMLALSAYLIFMLNCGINYHRYPFSAYLGLQLENNDTKTLMELTEFLIESCNTCSTKIDTKEAFIGSTSCGQVMSLSSTDTKEEAKEAMRKLGNDYPSLLGYYPNPKPVALSIVMSYENITGIYSAYFIEANYNRLIPDYDMAFTICHELSHLRGFMREDEANFIAYLACIGSGNDNFRYSGYLSALVYTLNALYKYVDADTYWQIYDKLCDQGKRDLQRNNLYWRQFETPVQAVSEAVNNIYLISNSQSDGTRSYGRCVDLILAYYKAFQRP